jgi:porphobilinogen synthase
MVRETVLTPDDFIWPLFVRDGKGIKSPIATMPGQFQFSTDEAVKAAKAAWKLGVPAVILFGIPEYKDALGTSGYDPKGIVPRTIKAMKDAVPELCVITDVCMCEYTDHGHCGAICDGDVDNDATLELLVKEALVHASAGADMVAPSDMMDGRVAAIRSALDEDGYDNIPIMAYAAKYASAFYGPFRDAAESPPKFGDRKSYQMDPANSLEAIREVTLDIAESADIVMVKPAMPYLDIIRRVKDEFGMPTAAYNVSGEYAMVKAMDKLGWGDGQALMMEMLLSIKRSGADLILTYFAPEAAKILQG